MAQNPQPNNKKIQKVNLLVDNNAEIGKRKNAPAKGRIHPKWGEVSQRVCLCIENILERLGNHSGARIANIRAMQPRLAAIMIPAGDR